MPDKYSYKPGKKKKAARRPAAVPQLSPAPDQPVAALPAPPAVKAIASPPPATKLAEGRIGARITNLSAELRRMVIIGVGVIAVLVASALILN